MRGIEVYMPPGTIGMFAPLIAEQRPQVAAASPHKTPIIPIPADAPPQNFRHQRYGSPTSQWEYRLAGGELAGYACRFDCYNAAGEPDKVVHPITYRDLGNGERAWRSKGLPAPRPLFRLPDIVGRPEAPCVRGREGGDRWRGTFP
jgi:putative DNA primase/helicase